MKVFRENLSNKVKCGVFFIAPLEVACVLSQRNLRSFCILLMGKNASTFRLWHWQKRSEARHPSVDLFDFRRCRLTTIWGAVHAVSRGFRSVPIRLQAQKNRRTFNRIYRFIPFVLRLIEYFGTLLNGICFWVYISLLIVQSCSVQVPSDWNSVEMHLFGWIVAIICDEVAMQGQLGDIYWPAIPRSLLDWTNLVDIPGRCFRDDGGGLDVGEWSRWSGAVTRSPHWGKYHFPSIIMEKLQHEQTISLGFKSDTRLTLDHATSIAPRIAVLVFTGVTGVVGVLWMFLLVNSCCSSGFTKSRSRFSLPWDK